MGREASTLAVEPSAQQRRRELSVPRGGHAIARPRLYLGFA